MPEPYHPDETTLQALLYALADPSRLRMVQELTRVPEIASTQFTSNTFARGTVAHHLKYLRWAGVTRTRLVGTRRLVSLRRELIDAGFPGLLDAILKVAPDQTITS